MNLGALSLENAPAFWTPIRFFLTVPVFGILAATIVLADGGQLFISRWQPASLALTHALTLGFIATGMFGALFQMLPVVMGASVPQTDRVAVLVHVVFAAGSLCLISGFLRQSPLLFSVAILLLVPVLFLFALGVLVAVFRAEKTRATARSAQLATLSLLITVIIGANLASAYVSDAMTLNRALTSYHAGWGLVGWIFVLVVGVSEQVIPMFLATPAYPENFNKRIVYLVILLLAVASLVPGLLFQQCSVVLLVLLMTAYALVTLRLLQKRRRKRTDITTWFWRVGMLSLLAGVAVSLYGYFGGSIVSVDLSIVAGLLLLIGFAVSLINGMLYKIVPFLVWLNLRMPAVLGKLPPGTKLPTPNIHEVIDIRHMKLQFLLHLAALALLLVAAIWKGVWVVPAGAALLVSNLLLLNNLVQAVRLYSKYATQAVTV